MSKLPFIMACRRTPADGAPIDPENIKPFPLAQILYSRKTNRIYTEMNRAAVEGLQWAASQPVKNYTVTNAQGDRLYGKVIFAGEPSNRFVLFLHGYRNSADNDFGGHIKYFHDLGFNVVLYDHQACGKSEGGFESFGLLESEDALLWMQLLKREYGSHIQIVLFGLSMGAATVLQLLGNPALPDNVRFAVADSAYTSAMDEIRAVSRHFHAPKALAGRIAEQADREFRTASGGRTLREVNALEAVKQSRLPLLLVHGESDIFVPTAMAPELFAASASSDKQMLLVKGANHAQSWIMDPEEYRSRLEQYISKYID